MLKLFLCTLMLSLLFTSNFAQTLNDYELLVNSSHSVKHITPKVHFELLPNRHVLLRYNPLSLAAASLMYTYRRFITHQFSAGCLYQPSCSAYSKALIADYGLISGAVLSADRLMRCNSQAKNDIPEFRRVFPIHESTNIYRIRHQH